MKNSTCLMLFILLFISGNAFAQITFERNYNHGSILSVEEGSDGSFITCLDSSGSSFIAKFDAFGNILWTKAPVVRVAGESILAISHDITGGYIAAGKSPDTVGSFGIEPFVLQLDPSGNNFNYRILPAADFGSQGTAVLSTPDSGYIYAQYNDDPGASNSSTFRKLKNNLTEEWHVIGNGSPVSTSAFMKDNAGRYLFGSFGINIGNMPTIRLIDSAGTLINSFAIPDTFQGGILQFDNCAIDQCADGNYFAGSTLTPMSTNKKHPNLIKLDDSLHFMWQKIWNWAFDASIQSIVATPDSGAMILLNTASDFILMRVNAAGDSIWSDEFNGVFNSHAKMMNSCADGGFIICGSTTAVTGQPFSYLLKLDKNGHILPPVNVTVGGPTTFCPGDSVTLSAPLGYLYLWSDSSTTPSITVSAPGTYFVTVTDFTSSLSAQSLPVIISNYAAAVPVISQSGNDLNSTPAIAYQWFFNGDTIAGETGQNITPVPSGTYTVSVVDSNGCIVTSAGFPFINIGINSPDALNHLIINKITGENIEVTLPGNETGTLRITDIRGIVLREQKIQTVSGSRISIPVLSLANGAYILTWTSGKSSESKGIVIGR